MPTADYKLYTYCKWNVKDLFNPILKLSIDYIKDNSKYIVFAADDTKLGKTGKKIPHASWQRDPNTCRALKGELRGCLLDNPEELVELSLTVPMISAILRKAA